MIHRILAVTVSLLTLLAASHPGLAVDRRPGAPNGDSRAEASNLSGVTGRVDRQTIRRLCEADLRILCAGIRPGGGRLLQCARAHEAQLSADCRAALETVEAYRNARPH